MKLNKEQSDKMSIPQLTAYYNTLPNINPVKKFRDRATALKRIDAVCTEPVEPVSKKKVSVKKGVRGPKLKMKGDIEILVDEPVLYKGIKQDVFNLIKKHKNVEKVVENSTYTEHQTRFAIGAFMRSEYIQLQNN